MAYWVRSLLVTGPTEDVEPAAERHRAHVRELQARGKVFLAGEFANGDGFLEILDVEDRREAERLCAESPLVELGLASFLLREWQRS